MNQELEEKPKKPPDLIPQQQQQLNQLLDKYQDVITNEKNPPRQTNLTIHPIITDDISPIKQKSYRLSPTEHDFVAKELDQIMEQVIIQLFQSPIVLVKKKNGKIRFCIDYRKLNKI